MEKTTSIGNLALVSPNYEDVAFCVEVCQSSGLAFQRFDKIEEAAESAGLGSCTALFADVRDEDAYHRVSKALGKALKSPQCVLAPELPISSRDLQSSTTS